jgi:uncharacterized protein with HEPN domain
MRPDEAIPGYLWDMRRAALEAIEFVQGATFVRFVSDKMMRRVERAVEVIGEAARRLPRGFREDHPEIAWESLITLRHLLAHE